ncbi:hypothetical protein QAD02_015058 [Eretmocerus hayati]|uniref:Uncharacterized protein n=1 Tax=Eretmocerus hayati TaxID=131215 RepID=A0ACC2P8T7_9HYME|nr:hypothetical protein QAD02_015058 [Eretmocerus hayati]
MMQHRYKAPVSGDGAPPFRVLSPGGHLLYENADTGRPPTLRSPPPSRAPEPYKITPQPQSRAQRKSSFAIIAEAKAPSPSVRSHSASRQQAIAEGSSGTDSPTAGGLAEANALNASGRISPFRGRGFKGPPPRAARNTREQQDSPPEQGQTRNRPRSRFEQRKASASQQNSPKRSQIPRPSRSRSSSASKENLTASNKASPKFGRRAVNRYTSSIVNNNANHRRPSPQKDANKRSELSPIQGTPTKPSDRNKGSPPKAAPRSNGVAGGALKGHQPTRKPISRNLLAPPRHQLPPAKRFVTANSPSNRDKISASAESLDSPSRIPLRRGSIVNAVSTPSLVNAKANTASSKSVNQLSSKNAASVDQVDADTTKVGQKAQLSNGKTDDEPSLTELLLKSSGGATGTASSVVNTTTATAVQPLQIDPASILPEAELVAKLSSLERKQNAAESSDKSPASATSDQASNAETMIKHFGPNAMNGDKSSTAAKSDQGSAKTNDSNSVNSGSTQTDKGKDDTAKRDKEEQEKQQQAQHQKQGSVGKASSKSTSSTGADSKRLSPGSSASNKATKGESGAQQQNGGSDALARVGSSESLGSLRSTDTGVSVNTVRGVSSAKEKSGLHVVKRPDEIETLSGNVVHLERNGERALSSGAQGNDEAAVAAAAQQQSSGTGEPQTRWQKLHASRWWPKRLGTNRPKGLAGAVAGTAARREAEAGENKGSKREWWPPSMRCLACKRDTKGQLWPGKKRGLSSVQLTPGAHSTRWARIKDACRCARSGSDGEGEAGSGSWAERMGRRLRGHQRQQQVTPDGGAEGPTPPDSSRGCCAALSDQRRRLGSLCRGLVTRSCCCCCVGGGVGSGCGSKLFSLCRRNSEQQRVAKVRAKHSLTSVQAPPVSEESRPKLPDVLVEHNSVMRGAIPCLPLPLAWFCLIFNVVLPGSGTAFSGLFNLCTGQPRFSAQASPKARFGALIVNFVVGFSQLFTLVFCLVGWGWSIWWGVTMLRIARKYKRFKDSEAAANDPEARGAEGVLPAPRGLAGAVRAATEQQAS